MVSHQVPGGSEDGTPDSCPFDRIYIAMKQLQNSCLNPTQCIMGKSLKITIQFVLFDFPQYGSHLMTTVKISHDFSSRKSQSKVTNRATCG